MIYEYQCDNGLGIVALSGHKSFQDAKETWMNIRQSIERDALKSVLMIDTSMSGLNPVEIINLESWISQIALPRNIKIAIVDSRSPSETNNWFGETVVRNRGWNNIAVFKDEESARKWLCP